ncbi:MAG: Fic family protein [Lachnospiraceae bacterium]|nr:Fic family protein [Lachnospiraceae bacterium]
MRRFDYKKYKTYRWDNEVLNYLSQIHEYKCKQELFLRQKPVEMEKLVEVAKVQSIESSNRIEGIITTSTRIGQLAREKTTPKNRDEREIAGYRDVLNTIHENYEYVPVNGNIILQLHRDLMQYAETGNGGRYKITQNYLKETKEDGTEVIRFTPVAPYETEPCINAICENYNAMMEDASVDPLLFIPVFLHDFLCIHPFNDGNGRMSRLLTLLLLYKSGYLVGKYISIEKHIEKTKDAYYDALEASSAGWHEEEDDPTVFVKYMLGVILACYREFESRVNIISDTTVISETESGKKKVITIKSKAYDIVKASVDTKIGKFTKRDIVNICPSISEKSVEAAMKKLLDEEYLVKHGVGKGTFYSKKF